MFHLQINVMRMFRVVQKMDFKGMPQREITHAVNEGMCNVCYHSLREADLYPCSCCFLDDDKVSLHLLPPLWLS